MRVLNNEENHSLDYIGKPPQWIIRWGNTLLFFVFLILFICSIVIHYNDAISTPIVISSENPPIHIAPKKTGKIAHLAVSSGQSIRKGQLLAVMENTGNYSDIFEVKGRLERVYDTLKSIGKLNEIFPTTYELGSVQESYSLFLNSYRIYINNISLKRNDKLERNLEQQLYKKSIAIDNQKRRLKLTNEDLELTQKMMDRQSALYTKGIISSSEFDKYQSALLNAQEKVESHLLDLTSLQLESTELEQLLTRSGIDRIESRTTSIADLKDSHQNLMNSIADWEENNVMYSPITGKISIFNVWKQFQNVEKDEYIFTVVPLESGKYLGRVQIPIRNSGKIVAGQKAIIKLDNFPHEEWGSLKGFVEHISDVPKKDSESYYSAYIKLADLETSYGKTIDFKQDMQGDAEIILEEMSILQRLFYQFRGLWN